MEYSEIVKTIQSKNKVKFGDITLPQVFMLLHDKVIKNIEWKHDIYELNFIPIEDDTVKIIDCVIINDKYEDSDTTATKWKFLRHFIEACISQPTIYVAIYDEMYEVKVELLESHE